MNVSTQREPTITVIEAGGSGRRFFRDLWAYRELFFVLAWRDISVRYKQTAIGALWAVIRPLLTMIVFTFVFGRIAALPSEGSTPYAVMVFAGMLPWFLFATILSDSSNSLVLNAQLVGKVYFPRVIIPAAAAVVSLVDLLVSFALFILLLAFYGVFPDWKVLALPVFIVLGILAALGPALLFAALNVRYRDFRYIIPFVVQFGLYISPVGFTSAVLPEAYRLLFNVNPIVSVIDSFRWCLLGGNAEFYWPGFILGTTINLFVFLAGLFYFRKTERTFADVI